MTVFRCEVILTGAPDLRTIDALARLQLAAQRLGISMTFHCADGGLTQLVSVVGLDAVVRVTPTDAQG